MSTSGQVTYRSFNPTTDRASAMAMLDTYLGAGYGATVNKYAANTFVAISGGQVVGVLVSNIFTYELEPGETPMAELLAIAVLPQWRGNRFAVADSLEQRFADGVPDRVLMASGVPASAEAFYTRRGYRKVGSSRWEKQLRGRASQRSAGQPRSASSLSRSRRRRAGA